jgi:hypothetical protein
MFGGILKAMKSRLVVQAVGAQHGEPGKSDLLELGP